MTNRLTTDELIQRLKSIKLLSLDVDGVLTDGGLYYAEDGSQLRKFNVKDGMGMLLVRQAGIEVAIITASKTPIVHHRGEVLGIPHVFAGTEDKLATLQGLCKTLGIGLDEVAHIGDDINDLPVLRAIGMPITVCDAVDAVLEQVSYVTKRKGGEGAVREICDLITTAKG